MVVSTASSGAVKSGVATPAISKSLYRAPVFYHRAEIGEL